MSMCRQSPVSANNQEIIDGEVAALRPLSDSDLDMARQAHRDLAASETHRHRWDDQHICVRCDVLDDDFRCEEHGQLDCCEAQPDVCPAPFAEAPQ